jgi:hypothetical protein
MFWQNLSLPLELAGGPFTTIRARQLWTTCDTKKKKKQRILPDGR